MPKKTILVVDDEYLVLDAVQEVLKKAGYSVITALSGQEALKKLKGKKVDLALIDIMMPVMDGWEVCAKIKANRETENMPLVFLTAKIDIISKSMGRLASKDYIEKPFENEELVARINKILKSGEKNG